MMVEEHPASALAADLHPALDRGDIDGLRRGAHTLRSNAATFGADSLVLAFEPRVGLLQDSLLATLSEARSLLRHSDSLTQSVAAIAEDIRPDIKATAEGIAVVTAKLEHFVDQVSRRPYRMFSGVRQPPRDSLVRDSTP